MSTFSDLIIRHKEHNIANKNKNEHPILEIGEWCQMDFVKSYRIFKTDNSPIKKPPGQGWARLAHDGEWSGARFGDFTEQRYVVTFVRSPPPATI